MLNDALVKIREALAQIPFIVHINNQDNYHLALELMDELVDDYEINKQLIELLASSIKRWEDEDDEFADFNKALACVELGSKSNVSKLLNAAGDKKLTRQHIEALSKRFDVSPALFF
ncbi:hypothetical protein Q7I37_10955 [Aeromonas allosaccharophila]|uniref:hypothetical protein n=1 Tax=Aeromonas allosaccharophila TaxID=656 RepID=UPI003004E024